MDGNADSVVGECGVVVVVVPGTLFVSVHVLVCHMTYCTYT
jgi:hypothetical protein